MKLFPLGMVFLLSSCAWVDSTRRSLLGDEGHAQNKPELVPRAQYEELLHKYEDVKQKYDNLKYQQEDPSALVQKSSTDASRASEPAPVVKPAEVVAKNTVVVEDKPSPVETVDVFASIQNQTKENNVDYGDLGSKPIDEQLSYFQQGLTLLESKKSPEALKIFQKLSTSEVQSIRSRSKLYSGQIFMATAEFDLALQVFEEILQQDSSSGATLKALEGLVICTEKLNLKNKKEKYQSLLNDIFEAGV